MYRFKFWPTSKNPLFFSIRPMNQKAWIEFKSPHFSYFQPIQYLVVMKSGAKHLLSPTKFKLSGVIKIDDIIISRYQG